VSALYAVRVDRDFVTDCHKSRLTMRRCRRTPVRLQLTIGSLETPVRTVKAPETAATNS
jgi:hypothetical protein